MKNLILVAVLLAGHILIAQNNSKLWAEITESRVQALDKQSRKTMPAEYDLYQLQTSNLISTLQTAPLRGVNTTSQTVITLPINGKLQRFSVIEAPVVDTAINEIYPDIKAYAAQGIDDPAAVARFSMSANGLNVMVMSPAHKTIYIDPYTQDKQFYISYSRASLPADPNGFECGVESSLAEANDFVDTTDFTRNADDGLLRTFRLAIAATGEYSQFHIADQNVPGGASDAVKKAAVLGAMNTTMTRVNGVFERDLGITMVIVPNNTNIIFLNAATDGLTNNNPGALINESQTVCDNGIGSGNYDIGHTFSTQGGGLAQLFSPCVSGQKARGITGINQPIGDSYDIDYVAHEMGHQYGGNHTQNNDCQRSNASVEPGSASTIMGYAGICAPNVQFGSDDYFNGINIIEMWNNISQGNSTCAQTSNTNNAPPVAEAGMSRVVPRLTPYILRGEATDPNSGDALTYCWEQRDAQVGLMPPQATNSSGPTFRSIDPQTSPDRYMPRLQTVLNGQTGTTWERLSTVSRATRFRLTVRDNVAGGGQSSSDNMIVSVNSSAGPFVVTSQNSFTTWSNGEVNDVTWNVANTTASPINATTVDILLSTDGGQNFDIVLVSATANDGVESITTPENIETETARIMVRASENIFYNVNSTNFAVTTDLGVETLALDDLLIYPNPSNGQFTISFTSQIVNDIEVSLYDVSGRLVGNTQFDNTGTQFKQTLDYTTVAAGMYFVKISSGDMSVTKQILKK